MAPGKHAAEPETVVIGSKTKSSSKGTKTASHTNQARPRPVMVNVRIEGSGVKGAGVAPVDLGSQPRNVLIRFSNASLAAFPIPDEAQQGSGQTVAGITAAQGTGDEGGATNTTTAANLTAPNAVATQPEQPRDLSLNVYDKAMEAQPPIWAFNYTFDWMDMAKDTPRDGDLPTYIPECAEEAPISDLVDMLAAADALHLRPFPGDLKKLICNRLSNEPPEIDLVKYIATHLSTESPVVKRCINAYLDYKAKDPSPYTNEEIDSLEVDFCVQHREFAYKSNSIARDRAPRGRGRGHRGANRGGGRRDDNRGPRRRTQA